MNNELRVIISGGGTGGHIFPAISIANAVKALCPEAKILFVGAYSRTSKCSLRYGRVSGWLRKSLRISSHKLLLA